MKKFKPGKLFAALCAMLAFVMVFSLAACNADGNDGKLTLNVSALTLDVGTENSPILVTSSVSEDVVWTSSDASVVKVEGVQAGKRVGMVTALAVGSATVTASMGGETATCTVTVIEKEVITITKDGTEVQADATLNLENKNDTLQLAATSSRGHGIEWVSDKPLVATVEGGLVKAKTSGGTATISAKCADHSDVLTSVKVQVGGGADTAYELENYYSTKAISGEHPGVWFYWNEFNNVTEATYIEGEVTTTAINLKPGANWYNIHLLYTAGEADVDQDSEALKAGQHYKVTFDLDSTFAGKVTVNGYVLQLKTGKHNYTAYYDHADTAFTLYWGVDGRGSDFINDEEDNQEITMKLSNIVWAKSEKIQIANPAFSITDNTLSISNTNPVNLVDPNADNPDPVGTYVLNLYKDNKLYIGVPVNPGHIDPATLPAGEFTAKLIVYASNAHYISTGEITATGGASITGTSEFTYTMEPTSGDGAVKAAGTWTYYISSWVKFSGTGTVPGGKATITFSNNAGNWTDTQLFYKVPGKAVGDSYDATLHINNVPKDGRIQIGNTAYTLQKGDNEIKLKITEGTGPSIIIIFGVYPEDNRQDIQAAENLEIYLIAE